MFDLHKILARFTSKAQGQEIPPLDGPMQPNDRLETATNILSALEIDNVCLSGDSILYSCGSNVFERKISDKRKKPKVVFEAENRVTCLNRRSDGGFAVGVENDGIHLIGGAAKSRRVSEVSGRALSAPSAIVEDKRGRLFIANASSLHGLSEWTADLLTKGSTGFVAAINTDGGSDTIIKDGLAFASGLSFGKDQSELIICESWKNRLIKLPSSGDGKVEPVLENLPGYPARIISRTQGGYWLCFYALRTQLLDFVLNDAQFRNRMIKEIDPAHWLAPSLVRSDHHMVPMQQGAVKKLGVIKPWAPPRSYGLIVELNEEFQPVQSLHSRSDGHRHGTTSIAEEDGAIYATSYGAGEIISFPAVNVEAVQ